MSKAGIWKQQCRAELQPQLACVEPGVQEKLKKNASACAGKCVLGLQLCGSWSDGTDFPGARGCAETFGWVHLCQVGVLPSWELNVH